MGRALLICSLIVVTLQAWAAASAMSLDEAKQVTAFAAEEEAFVPPRDVSTI